MSQRAHCQKVIWCRLVQIKRSLNLPIAKHNVEGPATSIIFLGITLEIRSMQASLPLDKLTRIRSVIQMFARSQVCTKKRLQSLLGMLNFAMRIIHLGHSFISQLLAFLPQAPDQYPGQQSLIWPCGMGSWITGMVCLCLSHSYRCCGLHRICSNFWPPTGSQIHGLKRFC